ncbi:cholecystokinin receptor type A [Biomphalaria glabrata]|nr:Biomphalaria glabrata cholecystokinin receptor type A-like [Biomphalaria glabrata]
MSLPGYFAMFGHGRLIHLGDATIMLRCLAVKGVSLLPAPGAAVEGVDETLAEPPVHEAVGDGVYTGRQIREGQNDRFGQRGYGVSGTVVVQGGP